MKMQTYEPCRSQLEMPSAPVRVGFLVSNISRLGGGVSEAVAELALSVKVAAGIEPVIFSANDMYTQQDTERLNGIEVVTRPSLGPSLFKFVPKLLSDVIDRNIDILHLHGIWQYPSMLGNAWRRRTGRPYVVSPHGMLESWILHRGRLKKTIGALLYERRNLSGASLVHALTTAERTQILAFAPRTNVAIIPNAVTKINEAIPSNCATPLLDRRLDIHTAQPVPYVLYLGRIHPKKNLESLIDAWIGVRQSIGNKGYRLVIAGWGEPSYVETIRVKIGNFGPEAQIDFVGPQYGDAKTRLLGSARWLILPSFSEGLPMAVLEAWVFGTPSIMSRFCNLPEGFEQNAALECDTTVQSIVTSLARALTLADLDWNVMSNAATDLVRRKFSADVIAETWVETYRHLLVETTAMSYSGAGNKLRRPKDSGAG
jgi:glycosyltransferase involved in cell wall biosynthesis